MTNIIFKKEGESISMSSSNPAYNGLTFDK